MHVTSFTKNNDITQSLHTSKAQTVFVVVISIRYFVITISFYYFIYIYTNKKKPFIYLFFSLICIFTLIMEKAQTYD